MSLVDALEKLKSFELDPDYIKESASLQKQNPSITKLFGMTLSHSTNVYSNTRYGYELGHLKNQCYRSLSSNYLSLYLLDQQDSMHETQRGDNP